MFLSILKNVPEVIHFDITAAWNLNHAQVTLDTTWEDFIAMCDIDSAIVREWNECNGFYVYLTLYWKRKAFPPGMSYIATLTHEYLNRGDVRRLTFEDIKVAAQITVRYSEQYMRAHVLNDTLHYGETVDVPTMDVAQNWSSLVALFNDKREHIELDIMDYYFTIKSMARRNTRPATTDYLKSVRALEIDMIPKLWSYSERILPWKQFNPTKYNVPVSHVPDFKRYYETLRNRNKYSSLKESNYEPIK